MQEYIKKLLGSRRHSSSALHNTTLIISNKDIEDLIKIVKSLENSGLFLKGVTESVENASLLGNLLTGKGVNKKR